MTIMVDGCFDPLHEGHIRYFEEAKSLDQHVICNIASDSYLATKHIPLLDRAARVKIISSLSMISEVVAFDSTTEALERLKPDIYFKGPDWRERALPSSELDTCQRLSIKIQYGQSSLNSSTKTLSEWHQKQSLNSLQLLEKLCLSESTVCEYNASYFTDKWRDYPTFNYDERRKIEGRNPELIKENLVDGSVLDVGCGNGALISFLHEIGVHARGCDVSEDAINLAPPHIKEKLFVFDVSKYHKYSFLEGLKSDLVICREVLEHLTPLEFLAAVHNITQLCNKYIYITTRFANGQLTLIDIQDEKSVDPTHITLFPKEFVRALLSMSGFRRCHELEYRMDWLNKGRCLVYERI